jgi:hypothetical protein
MEPTQPTGAPELPKKHATTDVTASASEQSQDPALTAPDPEESLDDEPDALNEHVQNPGDPDGLVAAEARKKWQAERAAPQMPVLPPRRKHKWPWVIVIVVLIAGAAYGAYWFGSSQADKKSGSATTAQKQSATQNSQSKSQKKTAVVPTKHYDSVTYTLGFDYPQTWTVSDTATKLTIASPTIPLNTIAGTTVNGHVVVTIQNAQSTVVGYPAGGANAAIESKKLTYKTPTPVQRAQTYLSYLGYGKAHALDALYITGDSGYQKDQSVPMADVARGNPLIGNDCATGTPTYLTLLVDKWPAMTESKQVEDLLQSITLD